MANMSDSEGEIKVVKGTVELKGADNYVVWKRSLGMRLATKELDGNIEKEPSVILSETLKRIILSSPTPTAAELTRSTRLHTNAIKRQSWPSPPSTTRSPQWSRTVF
jgi:hypothetical protein